MRRTTSSIRQEVGHVSDRAGHSPHTESGYRIPALVWRSEPLGAGAMQAAAQPNAPNWLTPLAASMLIQGNDRAAARFLWQQIAKSEEAWLRRNAERSLLQLQALDQIDQLEATVRNSAPANGEQYTWSGLMKRGALPGVPVDPVGTPYVIDPVTGRVTVSGQSPLFPMPSEPRQLQ